MVFLQGLHKESRLNFACNHRSNIHFRLLISLSFYAQFLLMLSQKLYAKGFLKLICVMYICSDEQNADGIKIRAH